MGLSFVVYISGRMVIFKVFLQYCC